MKRFTRTVFDGLRSTVQPPKVEDVTVVETLTAEAFHVAKTVRHGFPYQPTAIAFDPIQRILAVGTKTGSLRIIGRPGVDVHVRHESDAAVVAVVFVINDGALVTATADDTLHLWNLRQKTPQILHSLKFQRERITSLHLAFPSKWLYLGTERGNIHIVNIETFELSGYTINWNKAIELSRKTHPGAVLHLSECPVDPGKLLIGYESGQLVLWDIKSRTADLRYQAAEPLRSVCWHQEGKQFMCCHTDGSLTTWGVKQASPRPASTVFPHAKTNKEGKQEPCKPIQKVEWKNCKNGDSFVVFSGGLAVERTGRTPSITVVQGKTTTVLEMEHNVIDFTTLCENPYASELSDPYALVVLLHNDLVVVDLLTPGYPCFENPYSMDIHESPVTCCTYLADCPADLTPALYSAGARGGANRKQGFSDREWPMSGGEWGTTSCPYPEMILTGHADGSIKFWDASSVGLQILYKLKTAKVFEKPRTRSLDGEEDPFAIQHLAICPESRLLAVAGATAHCLLYRFCKQETTAEIPCLEVPILYDVYESRDGSPDYEFPPRPSLQASVDYFVPIHVRSGPQRRPPGYQVDLACLTPWVDGEPPGAITTIALNSVYGIMAYGNECGLVIIDYLSRTCLLSMATPDLYGSADPYQRAPRSPKRGGGGGGGEEDRCKSPASDQLNGLPGGVSPTTATTTPTTTTASPAAAAATTTTTPTTAANHSSHHSKRASSTETQLRRSRSQDKLDGSFSRSRSSSISSLENISSEAIQCLALADTYTRKNEGTTSPTLWVGTSLGSVIQITLLLPPPDIRLYTPASVNPSGTIFRVKRSVLTMSFLDCAGTLIPYQFESWRDAQREKKLERTGTRTAVLASPDCRMSPTNSGGGGGTEAAAAAAAAAGGGLQTPPSSQAWTDRQFVVIASEKVARVLSLPTQNCVFKQIITDVSFVVKAEVVTVKDSVSLVCYVASGHISVFSLPSLRQLVYIDFLPLVDLRIARTFCFTHRGHGLYLCSPSEVQKFTISADFCNELQELLGNLFLPTETPEAPKQSFFRGLFGGGVNQLDREELFGESSGKPSRSLVKHLLGPNSVDPVALSARAGAATSDIGRAKMLAIERGQKLGELEERTARMVMESESFSSHAHQLMAKYRDKKWYQL